MQVVAVISVLQPMRHQFNRVFYTALQTGYAFNITKLGYLLKGQFFDVVCKFYSCENFETVLNRSCFFASNLE
jgi:hypothetical protein